MTLPDVSHAVAVHPVSTLLFLIGYGLVLPIAFGRARIKPKMLTLAFAGHQLGLGVAALGWLLRGSVWIAAGHIAWAVVARVWFQQMPKP